MRKVKPLNDRILVKDEAREKEKKLASGVIIPQSAEEEGEHQIGDVVEVGLGFYKENGEFLRPLNVKPGEKVIYGKYSGINCIIDGIEYRLMQEIDLLGTVVDE